jgi:hypothetical protein
MHFGAFTLHALRRPAMARRLVALLVLALGLASTLGLMHRTLHTHGPEPGVMAVAVAAVATTDHAADAAEPHGLAHVLKLLFAGHSDGDLQCRLYDQLAHGSALPSLPLLWLPVVLPTAVFDFMQGQALVRWVLLFDARGPPAAR